jgi:hypothetical protein
MSSSIARTATFLDVMDGSARLAGEVTAARNQVAALAPNSAAVRQLDTALAGHNLA